MYICWNGNEKIAIQRFLLYYQYPNVSYHLKLLKHIHVLIETFIYDFPYISKLRYIHY